MKPQLEDVLAAFNYGLYVLTVEADGWPMAQVVSWVSQASYEPPLVVVGVRQNRYARDLIREKKAFALFVLAPEDLESVSGRFKNKDVKERLKGIDVRKGATGAPLIDLGLGYVECTLEDEITLGDHSLFIGRIQDGKMLRKGRSATTQDYGKVYLGRS